MVEFGILFFLVLLSSCNSEPFTTLRQTGESWKQCGQLLMSTGCYLSANDSAKFIELADMSLMEVKVSVSNGELFCRCKAVPKAKSAPFWINVSIPLACNRDGKTAGDVNVVNVNLPLLAEYADLGANGVHLTCMPQPGSPSTPAATSQLLKVPHGTAVRFVSRGEERVNPVSLECEMNANGIIILDGNWRGMREHRKVQGVEEEEDEAEEGGTAVILVDLAKLKNLLKSCHLQHSTTLQLHTDLGHKSLHFLQVFSIDIDSCVKNIDSVVSLLPLLISHQPVIHASKLHPTDDFPILHAGKLPPKDDHVDATHSEGHVHATLLRRTREVNDDSLLPTTVHVDIMENSPIGTVVTIVQVQDEDVVSYCLVKENRLFTINASTGVIRTKSKIDRETMEVSRLMVNAKSSNGSLQNLSYVISVLDENDHTPTFQDGTYFNLSILEDAPVMDILKIFTIIDDDVDFKSLLHCTLLNNTDQVFSLSPSSSSSSSFALTLVRPLNYETQTDYHMILFVRDHGNPPRSSLAVIDVYIRDVADNIPVFHQSSYSVQLPENTAVNSTILFLQASVADSSPLDVLEYHLVMPEANNMGVNMFQVGAASGNLVLRSSLDYEESEEHYLRVQARSLARPQLLAEVAVTVLVTNINDHIPIFGREGPAVFIKEAEPGGMYVTVVTADDADSGVLGEITYSFAPELERSISATFDLAPFTGVISTRSILPHGEIHNYTLVVVGADGGTPSRSSRTTVEVCVLHSEETRPEFQEQEYHAEVTEGSFMMPILVTRLQTIAQMGGEQYFIQSGNEEGVFKISAGNVSVQGVLDRERRSSYELVVVVLGGGRGKVLEGSTRLHVKVLDVNDETPIFVTTFYSITISEDVVEEELLIGVLAEDGDEGVNGRVTYSLRSPTDHPFQIDGGSGAIMLREGQSLDYEDPFLSPSHNHTLIVVAMDGGENPLSSSAMVVICVQDVNDNAPEFSENFLRVSILENTSLTSIVQVTATDADSAINAQVRYAMLGDMGALRVFRVSDSGHVYTTGGLDREMRDTYHLTILAIDSGSHSMTSSVPLLVEVEDVADDPPLFSREKYSLHIDSRVMHGSVLTTVTASTRDLSVNGSSICYSIISSGAPPSLFEVDSSGNILAAVEIIPGTVDGRYELMVKAEHLSLSSSATIEITISDNNGTPVISPLTIYLSVYLSSLPSSISLGLLSVEYPKDIPMTFSLLPSPHSDVYRHFDLRPSSGLLSVKSSVSSRLHVLDVSASANTSVGVASVPVYVAILTNTTLENAVGVLFGGVSLELFLLVHMEPFLLFVSKVAETSRDSVEVCGIQGIMNDDYNGGVELMMAVRSRDILRGYISPNVLRGLLYTNAETSPLHYDLSPGTCTSDSCQNLLTCQPFIQLHALTDATPIMMTSIAVPGVVYLSSHSFSHTHRCNCPPGYSRHDLCTSEIDECAGEGPCSFGGICVDLVADYICHCQYGTVGKNCSTLCSSQSCDPCTPNPCKYGGSCSVSFSDGYQYHVCKNCLWEDEYSAPNCELLTASFTSGSFLALPTPAISTRFKISLSFATIASSALLLYVGRLDGRMDHVTVEVLVGQVKVGVSFGGTATVLSTNSEQRLNDGEWHTVTMEIRDRVVMVEVTNCSVARRDLIGAEYLCQLHAPLHPLDHRILELETPLFVGGLEPLYATSAPLASLTSLNFDGCISNLTVNHALVDLNVPLRGALVTPGCPPSREIWGGSSCDVGKGPNISLSEGSSLTINSSSPFSNNHFILDVRTRSSNILLVDFGGLASLTLHEGSVMYTRWEKLEKPALTLLVDAHIDDGLWHRLELTVDTIEGSFTQLSIDTERVVRRVPEMGDILVRTLTFGSGLSSHTGSSSSSSICLRNLIINIKSINLAAVLTSPFDGFIATKIGTVTEGCGSDSNSTSCRCPGGSVRVGGWRNCLCVCPNPLVPIRGQCNNPCLPNPCSNSGFCSVLSASNGGRFSCQCKDTYSGPLCEEEEEEECDVGFFKSSSSCQRCRCDLDGVEDAVCDRITGACFCKSGLYLYEQSGDQDLDCNPCDCDSVGAVSPMCESVSGQCTCRANVTGRRCDKCLAGTAALDSRGCRAATMVQGSFTLADTAYQHQFGSLASFPDGIASATSLQADLEGELHLFGLPCLFQASVLSLSNKSGLVGVSFSVASYMSGDSTHLPCLSEIELVRVLQVTLQSGRVGGHIVNSTSFSITDMCTSEPRSCPECIEGLQVDNYLCRATPSCVTGGDVDRDGFPDGCDDCPFIFDPEQSPSTCQETEGVCAGSVELGILWSPTPESEMDIKPCPAPLIGFASRKCSTSGWALVNLIGCISAEGRGLLFQVATLEDRGQILTLSELGSVADTLRKFVGNHGNISGGDVQVAGRLLNQLVIQLEDIVVLSNDEQTEDNFQRILLGTDLLLNPELSEHWKVTVKEVQFDSGDFLSALEQLSRVVGSGAITLTQYSQPNIVIRREPWKPIGSHDTHVTSLELQQRILSLTTIRSSNNVLPPAYVTFALLPTLGPLLPERANFNISDMTIATPVLSIQAASMSGSEVTEISINVTLVYTQVPTRLDMVGMAVCVAWDYQGSGGWSRSDCKLLEANLSSVSCYCPHLTAFAVLLPTAAYLPLLPALVTFHPALYTYVVLVCVCVILLVGLFFLFFVQDVPTTVPKQLLTSFFLTTLLYLVAIDRTEFQVVCGVLGLVLVLVMLLPLSWMFANAVLIAHFLVHDLPPKKTFVILLHMIGWGLPLLLCAISMTALAVKKKTFFFLFAHPDNCWLVSEVVWVYVAPAMFIIILYFLALAFCLCKKSSLSKTSDEFSKWKNVRGALFVSMGTVVLFVLSWLFGLLSLYELRVPEYVFVGLHALTTLYLITVHCLVHCFNPKARAGLVDKFRRRCDSLPSSPPASTDAIFTTSPMQTMMSELQPRPPRHSASNSFPFQRSATLTSVPSGVPRHLTSNLNSFQRSATLTTGRTPGEFDRQLASLSHQLCYNSAHLDSDEGYDMATPPPHSPSPPPPLPPSPPKFTLPADHNHQPWFADPSPFFHLGVTTPVEDRSSLSEEDGLAMTNDCREDQPRFILPGSYLSQINEDETEQVQDEDTEDIDSRDDEGNLRRIYEDEEDPRRWRRGEELRYSEKEDECQRERVEESHPMEYIAKEHRSLVLKIEDPLWYKPRDSLLDSYEGVGEKEEAEEEDHVPQAGDGLLKESHVETTVNIKHRPQQPQTLPLCEGMVPLPYETATPTMNQNSFDPMHGRPLPPTPVDEVEWWSSPPPPPPPFSHSSPLFQRGRSHTARISATSQSPNTASWRELHQHNSVAAMDTVTMVAKLECPDTVKRRYRRIQVGNEPEDLVQNGHDEMIVPHSATPLLPGAVPFHIRVPNGSPSPPSSATFKDQTSHNVRDLPRIATHPLLKRIQPCRQWAGDMPLPPLTCNPMYHTGSNAKQPNEGGRRGQGEEDSEISLGKQVVRRHMDSSQTLV